VTPSALASLACNEVRWTCACLQMMGREREEAREVESSPVVMKSEHDDSVVVDVDTSETKVQPFSVPARYGNPFLEMDAERERRLEAAQREILFSAPSSGALRC
jgi:hypothetical protein